MTKRINIAIDAMSGENSPKKIIDGIEISLKKSNENYFILYGNKDVLLKEIENKGVIKKNCEIIHTPDIIKDNESPLAATKNGKESSMWKAIQSQKLKKVDISLSAGNTGALLLMSRLILNTIDGIDKPALAGLWPNNKGVNVVLDLGANVVCSHKNLLDFSSMGSALHRSLYKNEIPKVALLNIGLEEHKGSDVLKKTFSSLKNSKHSNFEFCGFIEGNQIMDGDVNVIITDGFTGNIALKTAEGTANFITKNLKSSLNTFSLLLSYSSLKKFKEKLDPRKFNGAIFLGLEGPVVKSHGSTDAIGFSYSIDMCNKIIKSNLIEKIKSNLITVDQ